MGKNFFATLLEIPAKAITKKLLANKQNVLVLSVYSNADEENEQINLIGTLLSPFFDSIQIITQDTTYSDIIKKIRSHSESTLFISSSRKISKYVDILTPTHAFILSPLDIAPLKAIIKQIGKPKNVISIEQNSSPKISLIEENTSISTTVEGAKVTIRLPESTHEISFPNMLLSDNMIPVINALIKLILGEKKDISLLSKTVLKRLQETSTLHLVKAKEQSFLLKAQLSHNDSLIPEVLRLVKILQKELKGQRILVIGEGITLTAKLLKSANHVILIGEQQKSTGIKKAQELGFILNENLFWYENEQQGSFHLPDFLTPNALFVLLTHKQSGFNLSIAELSL